MKVLSILYQSHIKAIVVFTALFVLNTGKTKAQAITGNGAEGDTVTYVLYNNELSFDSKRTLVFEDKHSIDSLVNVLAKPGTKSYKVVYQKEGQQAKMVAPKFLQALNKTGIYRLTIAYNRPELAQDGKPLYIIRSK